MTTYRPITRQEIDAHPNHLVGIFLIKHQEYGYWRPYGDDGYTHSQEMAGRFSGAYIALASLASETFFEVVDDPQPAPAVVPQEQTAIKELQLTTAVRPRHRDSLFQIMRRDGRWLSGNVPGDSVEHRASAGTYSGQFISNHRRTLNNCKFFLITVGGGGDEDGRKSDLGQFFNAGFIKMMQSAPNNPGMRGHMLRILLSMPPKELTTFDQLKDWVETNFEYTTKPAIEYKSIPTAATRPLNPTVSINFISTEHQSGRCHFNRTAQGSARIPIPLADIRCWINDGSNINEVMGNMVDFAQEQGMEVHDYKDEEYDDHVYDESDPEVSVRNRATAIDALRAFLAQHDTGLLDQLDRQQRITTNTPL